MPHKLDGELGDGYAWCAPLGTAHARQDPLKMLASCCPPPNTLHDHDIAITHTHLYTVWPMLLFAACSLLLCCLVIKFSSPCFSVSLSLKHGHARASPPRLASQRRGDSRPAGRARAVAGAHKAPLLAAAACRRGGCVVDCLERGQPPRSLAQSGGADAWRKVGGRAWGHGLLLPGTTHACPRPVDLTIQRARKAAAANSTACTADGMRPA